MKETYYKLAVWDERSFCFRDGKKGYPTQGEAVADAKAPGRYRISRVDAVGRTDLEPFDIAGKAATHQAPIKTYTPAATRPMGGRAH